MSEWPTMILGEICEELTVGHVGSMASQYVPAGVPFLRSQNIRAGRLDLTNLKYISPEFHWKLKKSRLRSGDIVIVRTGEPGAAALIPAGFEELNCSDLVIARPGDQVDARYLCYAINATAGRYVDAHLVGAVQQHFNVASARLLRLPVPSIDQQHAIATVAAALDDKIAVNDHIVMKSRELAQYHFKSAAQQPDAEARELSSMVTFLSRGVAPRYTEDETQLMVLNQKCIRAGRVQFGPARRTLLGIAPGQKMLQVNDVLVNSTGSGTLGRVARWTQGGQATVDSHVTIVRFDTVNVDPVCAGFAMLAAQSEIEALGEGSTGQTELSRARLGALTLSLPSKPRSSALRRTLDALEGMGNAAIAESASLAELRDTLLPKLMSGEIRVRDAEKAVEAAT